MLQVLNVYCDDLASGRAVRNEYVTFLIKQPVTETASAAGTSQTRGKVASRTDVPEPLRRIDATLPARGSLAPLLHAFGLLSSDDLVAQETPGTVFLLFRFNLILHTLCL